MTSVIPSARRWLSPSSPRALVSSRPRSRRRPRSPTRAALERQAEINKRPDTPGTGAFPAMKEEIASLPRHVVYRPRDLSALGRTKLGVVAWGNGGCSDDAASSRFHLLEIASHGYLVLASGRILERSGRAAAGAASGAAPRSAPAAAHAGIGSDRRRRLGARREPARRQPLLRPHRCGADRVFGLELRRRTGAARSRRIRG